MIEYIEVKPLPLVCQKCEEKQRIYNAATEEEKQRMETEEDFYFDCGSCDYAGERWQLSRRDELTLLKKGKLKAIERLQREIAAIDKELASLE